MSRLKRFIREYRRRVRILKQYGMSSGVAAVHLAAAVGMFTPKRTICFLPDEPDQYQVISKLVVLNKYRMVKQTDANVHVVHKHIKATSNPPLDPTKVNGLTVLNARCNDISKANVQRRFEEVFGYALAVDPETFVGQAVRKSDENYRHDGQIVNCPFTPEEEDGVVYQRLVDTSDGNRYCIDHRVPIYGDTIPFVYVKERPIENRFAAYDTARIVETSAVLSELEVDAILRFCRVMGLDYGELDVLRDNTDDRIYIVDVNNTPAGPPVKLSIVEQQRALRLLGRAYDALIDGMVSNT